MKRTPLVRGVALVATLSPFLIPSVEAAILIASDSPGWRYRKGDAEASNPTSAWRASGFNDSTWSLGDSPLRYGDGAGGTVLNDMRNGYSTVFLRRTFNVSDVALISRLDLNVDYDDGFTVWINGTEVLSQNAPATPSFDAFASTNHESGAFESFELSDPASFLADGDNTIAIQVFNVSLGSSDMMMNPELVSTAPDFNPPAVAAFGPPPGTVLNLTQLTVTFTEPVTGVDAPDLEINEVGAQSVSGSGDRYTFTFSNVPLGGATVTWAQDHGIADTATIPNAFDSTVAGEVRIYNVVDNLPPSVTGIFPPSGVTLRSFSELEVTFSEPVAGVEAADLLAGGVPASSVSGSGAGPYRFVFAGVGEGAVAMSWDAGHGIEDFAADPNAFVANNWSYSVDPNAAFGDLVINELIASNRSGLLDEDGEASDWIELFNFGATAVELAGWSLSDDASEPGKFVLPSRSLPAGGYLVIFATGKDRAPVAFGEIHTSFKLSGSGEYLGLFAPESPRSTADEIAAGFPQQRNDHSYGRDSAGAWRYFDAPTPGAANGDSTITGLLGMPHANAERGFYDRPFDLHLTVPTADATIRYTTDGSEPTANSGQIYSAPITIDSTTVFRAVAFKPGFLPSEVASHTYLYNASSAIRSLPVVSLTTDDSNLWGPTGIQESNPRNCAQRGIAWERPVSAEVLVAGDGSRNTQVDCGLRVQGGNYVRGRYSRNGGLPFSKYSFRLYFRGDYGPTMWGYPFFQGHAVKTYDRITLRAGMNDHSNPFIVDEMVRRTQFDTGNVAARGNFVNLFINGEHKGYYNPTERIDDDFMRSWHGGDEAWDVIAQFGEVREGDAGEWNNMRTVVGRDQSVAANYAASLDVLDVDNFIDYLLVNIYGGTGDWPHNNWRAARQRTAGSKFRFYVWDAEWSLGNQNRSVNVNTITGELGGGSEIATLFQSLTASPEFRLRFADRAHKHFYNDGALVDAKISDHYEGMRSEMSAVLPGMSANIRNTWIPLRRDIMMQHLTDADLQHSDDAPTFAQFGGAVSAGFELTMTAPNSGTIYYTVDGTDPREALVDDGGGGLNEILAEDAAKRVLVPSDGAIGTSWTGGGEPFDDSSWTAGTGGVGYDEATTYDTLIDIDVDAEMNDINTSLYIRIPFTVTAGDLADANFMQLKGRYDDGFIAYLNGVRIADGNGPASPTWNSESVADNPDGSAVNPRSFYVSDFMGELVIGSNLLAIHGLNGDLGSSDFLASFSIEVGENFAGDVSDTAIEYVAPVPIAGTMAVRSRTLRNGVWSAMSEATFINGPAAPQLRITEIMYNPDGGSALEFIEIQNVGPLPADLSFMQVDGVNFSFPGETALGPGEHLVLASNNDPDGFAAAYPGVTVLGHFGGSLSNGGERVALLDAFGNTLASVDYSDSDGWPAEADGGGSSLSVIDPNGDPDDPANWTGGGTPGVGTILNPLGLMFNEVRAGGGAGEADFIELYNLLLTSVNLEGWGLSDDAANPMRFTFPAGAEIAPGGNYLVVWCDSEPGPGLHSGFGLDRDGESLFLTNPDGDRIDAVSFGRQEGGYSLNKSGTLPGGLRTAAVATPGEANGAAVSLAPQSQLSINEWLADPVPGGDDWLELYNRDATNAVALQGLHISSGEATFRIGALSFLEPGGFIRLWADGGVGPDHLDLRLSAEGGTLTLTDIAGAEFETVTYGQQDEGVPRGRLPDGAANITTFPTGASPGAPNHVAVSSEIVFNELLAGAIGWVELRNAGASVMSLDGFSIAVGDRDSEVVPLPDGISLAGGDYAKIDLALARSGGAVFLIDPGGREVDRVVYGNLPEGMSIGLALAPNFELLVSPSPGAPNGINPLLGSGGTLRINEWLADADTGGDDYVEIYNPDPNPVLLSGLRLTDDLSQSGIDQFAFPPLSFIAAGGFVALTADNSRLPGHLPFNLDADGETLRLHTATGTAIVDEVTWGIETEGISSGRTTDGGSTLAPLAFQSPGASNELDPTTDSDGDGIPDLWETANGINPNDPDDAALDLDGDTRSALFEYLSGTDPNDRASVLAFESMTLDLTGFNLTFTARAGIRYTVEFSDDLGDANWGAIKTVEPSPTDHTETVFDIGGDAERFYRIIAERP